jgi:hypothetical protein
MDTRRIHRLRFSVDLAIAIILLAGIAIVGIAVGVQP